MFRRFLRVLCVFAPLALRFCLTHGLEQGFSLGKYLLIANLVACGLSSREVIWYVQIVQYPQFADVGEAAFGAFHRRHSDRTTLVVALPMVTELGLAGLFVALRPEGFPAPLAWVAAILVGVVWAATFFVSVPLHNQLGASGYDAATIAQLVRTNWVRTAAWTARFALLLYGTLRLLP